MSTIRVVYLGDPNFPATDQHPNAERFTVWSSFLNRNVLVDAIGGVPTTQEVDAKLNPPGPTADELEADCHGYLNGGTNRVDLRKVIKAKFVSDLAWRLGKAPGALTNAELIAERNRIAAIYKAL